MSSNFLSKIEAKDKRELVAKTTKAVIDPGVNLGTNIAVDAVCKYPAVGKAVGTAAAGLASAAIDEIKAFCDRRSEENPWN